MGGMHRKRRGDLYPDWVLCFGHHLEVRGWLDDLPDHDCQVQQPEGEWTSDEEWSVSSLLSLVDVVYATLFNGAASDGGTSTMSHRRCCVFFLVESSFNAASGAGGSFSCHHSKFFVTAFSKK